MVCVCVFCGEIISYDIIIIAVSEFTVFVIYYQLTVTFITLPELHLCIHSLVFALFFISCFSFVFTSQS